MFNLVLWALCQRVRVDGLACLGQLHGIARQARYFTVDFRQPFDVRRLLVNFSFCARLKVASTLW